MTTAMLESPRSLFGEAHRSGSATGAGTTLEELLERTLRSARTDGLADCPVCHARMEAQGEAARCSRCGSTLS
jgi:tRNA(Ile2) C34 agmatinyltransferase TiaS